MKSQRSDRPKDSVTARFPNARCVSDDKVGGFKILSGEVKGKRILGRGASAWGAWLTARTNTQPAKTVQEPVSLINEDVTDEELESIAEQERQQLDMEMKFEQQHRDKLDEINARLEREQKERDELPEIILNKDSGSDKYTAWLWIVLLITLVILAYIYRLQ